MTTRNAILKLILSEIDGSEREDVLEALSAAFVAADEDDDADLLDDSEAHRLYCEQYNAAAPKDEIRDYASAREVCRPDWAPLHAPLLTALARHERKSDEAMLAYCRREMTARA